MRQSFGSLHIKHPSYGVDATLDVSYNGDTAANYGAYVSTATLVLNTGACAVQIYATAPTLRQMADMLLRAADAVDAGVAAAVPVVALADEVTA